jgi:hypothetical protein
MPSGVDERGLNTPVEQVALLQPAWRAYRLVSSAFPPIAVFEDVLDPADLALALAIESLTNERLLDEAGVLQRVPPEDRISGPGSTPVMAAFTHIGAANRFSNGSFGVYYCASSLKAAIAETAFHRARFLQATGEGPLELTMRAYINSIVKPLHDVRTIDVLHAPSVDSYPSSQRFAVRFREAASWGLLYRSVRAPGAECAAIFRPPAVSIPVQGPHLRYVWDGTAISEVFKISRV